MPLPFRTYLINAGKTRRSRSVFADYLQKCVISNQMRQYESASKRGAALSQHRQHRNDSSVSRSINATHVVIMLCTSVIQP